jgi:hypothetical protein
MEYILNYLAIFLFFCLVPKMQINFLLKYLIQFESLNNVGFNQFNEVLLK